LDDLVHVDVRQTRRDEHLDHQFVPRTVPRDRAAPAKPPRELLATLFGDAVVLLALVLFDVVGLRQAVALEALQRRVDLTNVEGPHFPSARLEL